MRFIKLIFLLHLYAMLLISCSSAQFKLRPTATWPAVPVELTERSWLIGQPCQTPCWYGMKVGESTRSEVLTRVQTISFLKPNVVREYDLGYRDPNFTNPSKDNIGLVFNCVKPENRECVYLDIVENRLDEIMFNLTYKISFKEVVDTLGPPNYLRSVLNDGPPETRGCGIDLIWSNRQLVVESFEPMKESGRDLCVLFHKNKERPYSDLYVTEVRIVRQDTIAKWQKSAWNGFFQE